MKLFKNSKVIIVMLLVCILTSGAGSIYKHRDSIAEMAKAQEVQPVIELKTNQVTLDINDAFDASKYIVTATDEHGKDMKDRIAKVDIDTSQEGEYDVVFDYDIDGFKPVKKVLRVVIAKPQKDS